MMKAKNMDLQALQRDGTTMVVAVKVSRLDAAQAAAFKAGLLDMLRDSDATRLVLDFSAVNMIDSSGLGALVSVLKSLDGRGSIGISGANEKVRSVFRLTRMDRVFPMHDSVDIAVAA